MKVYAKKIYHGRTRRNTENPMLANMIEGEKTPCLSAEELEKLGFKFGVFPLSGLFAAAKAIEDCFRFLKENGTTSGFENTSSFQYYKEIINIKNIRNWKKSLVHENHLPNKIPFLARQMEVIFEIS